MNIVFVKHGKKNKRYAFEVPDFLVSRITKGMELLVETKNGLQIGTAVSGVISGDGALDGDRVRKANIATIETAKHVIDTMIKYGYWSDMEMIG